VLTPFDRAVDEAYRRREAQRLAAARRLLLAEKQARRDSERLENSSRYTRRHRWSLAQARKAVAVFDPEPERFCWLLGPPMRVGLLAELGRFRTGT
jgi:hypothetical protein